MTNTYIVIDSKGRAKILNERSISAETTSRLAKGESFNVYRAEAMKVNVTLTPAGGGESVSAVAVTAGATKKKRKYRRKNKNKSKATRKAIAAKTETSTKAASAPNAKPAKKAKKAKRAKKAGVGKAGRPRTNVGPCTVEGCEKEAKTRGLCSAHYQQYRRGSAKQKAKRAVRRNKAAKKK